MSAHAGDHVTRLDGAAIEQIFTGRNQPHHIDGGLEFGQGAKHAQHAGGSRHVVLHLIHFRRRLDGDTAAIEGDALTDQHRGRHRLGRPAVLQNDKAQRLLRALGHGQEGPHAKLAYLLGAQNFTADLAVLGCQRLGSLGQQRRCGVIGRPIGPFLGQLHAGAYGDGALKAVLQLARVAGREQNRLQAARLGLGFGAGVAVAGVRHGQHGGPQRRGLGHTGKGHDQLLELVGFDAIHRCDNPAAHVLSAAIADTDDQHPRGQGLRRLVQRERLANLGLGVTLLDGKANQNRKSVTRRLVGVRHQHQQRVRLFTGGFGQTQGF